MKNRRNKVAAAIIMAALMVFAGGSTDASAGSPPGQARAGGSASDEPGDGHIHSVSDATNRDPESSDPDHAGQGPGARMSEIPAESYVRTAIALPRTGWTATASDQGSATPASNVLDGNTATIWHSQPSGTPAPLPHTITIDMHALRDVSGLTYTPRQDTSLNGNVGRYTVTVSTDGLDWSAPVIAGTWTDNKVVKEAAFDAVNTRFVRLTATTEAGNRGPWSSAAEINLLKGAVAPPALPRTGWTATASDQGTATPAGNVLDGNVTTLWHSQPSNTPAPLPHSITIDMQSVISVAGLSYLPRADSSKNGNIGNYSIAVSADGTTWSAPIASGAFTDDTSEKTVAFARISARHVRLTATTEAGGRGPWSSASEINLRGSAPAPGVGGRWSAVIGFPIVPASAVLLPNNKLLTFSAYSDTHFNHTATVTRVAILDLVTGLVTQPSSINTQHQMFCTGLAVLADGRVLIDGGSTDRATTIYNPATNSWTKGPLLNTARAYQGDTLLSTGKVLTLGGSWSDSAGGKNGEIFTASGATGSWVRLSGVLVSKILTADPAGVYRSDNHAWLFGVAGGMAFHAGPSKQMNWISTTGTGSIVGAGNRGTSPHSMNGNAVMYDIGKILTVGGATAYQDVSPSAVNVQAHRRADVVDISAGPTLPVVTTRVSDMAYQRVFANSVVLPDGKVLMVGGQQHPQPFTDTGAVFSPELWDPATGGFTIMAPGAIARTYHSVAVLLPDGRVFSGGGGLCGGCTTNHLNGQIFTPPYLLNSDGSPRTRPSISAAPAAAAPGSAITVTTSAPTPAFSLVRMSAVTHTVNSDQRRIPLTPTATNGTTYTLTIPGNTGVVLPGNYLLFAFDAQGTPSTAKIINIR